MIKSNPSFKFKLNCEKKTRKVSSYLYEEYNTLEDSDNEINPININDTLEIIDLTLDENNYWGNSDALDIL